MGNNPRNNKQDSIFTLEEESLFSLTPLSCKEKRSVRTTLRLSSDTKETISRFAKYYNITQKEVLDLIYDFTRSLDEKFLKKVLQITKESDSVDSGAAIRKTWVISRGFSRYLKTISDKYKISRNLAMEQLILLYRFAVEKQREKECKVNTRAYEIVGKFLKKAEDTEGKLAEFLIEDDPVLSRISLIIVVISNLYSAIDTNLKEGTPIESDDMSQSC